ncbi:hypothetical protein J4207_00150 [Candidatus Woesearchaeota archaeon]|nr:hypothetical protein [Candidatus Woesearchaeota archaeon]
MEQFLIVYQQSLRQLRVADHIFNVTHPLLQDPKLLLGVIDNLYISLQSAMKALLLYDCARKNIPAFLDTADARVRMFQVKSMPLHHLDMTHLNHFYEIRELIRRHRTSSVEFRRKDQFVICTPNYELTIVTADKIRRYLIKTKQFVELIGTVIQHERISRRSAGRTEAC